MRHALVVAWKEFRTFFQTPIGYVILFVFTALGGWWFFSLSEFFKFHEASIRGLLDSLPWLFLVLAPALTMRAWAEERRTGTIETLLTLPVRDGEIVLGKFLGSLGLVAVWLVCLLPIVGVVFWLGHPDRGPVLAGLFGALLLGGAYVALGLAASAVTENQIIALVLGVALSFFFFLVGYEQVTGLFPDFLGAFLYNLSLHTHFRSITRGVIDSRDVLFYLSFIGFFLMANVWAVRRAKGLGIRVLLTAGILVFLNYLGVSHFTRLDLTEDKRFTLADATKRTLGKLEDDLRLTAYLSSDVPPEFSNVRRDIEDLVHEFGSYAGTHLHVEIVDPDKSEKAKKQADDAGIHPAPLTAGSADKVEVKNTYVGIVIDYGGKSEQIPFAAATDRLEYDMIRRIAKLTRKGEVKVGWQVSDPYAGLTLPNMPHPPGGDKHTPNTDLKDLDEALREQYSTSNCDLKSKVPDDVKSLILCNAENLSETQRYWLDQYVMRGGGLIVVADGTVPQSFGGMGQGGSPFFRSGNEKLPNDLFSNWGFTIRKDLVLDLSCYKIPMPVQVGNFQFREEVLYPAFPVSREDSLDQSHPITSHVYDLIFPWASSIELDPKPGVKAIPLAKSSPHSRHLENFIMADPRKLDPRKVEPQQLKSEYKEQFVLAALLEGSFHSYFTTHELPKEIVEGKPAEGAKLPGGLDGLDLPDSPAKALEKPTKPADPPKKDEEKPAPAAPSAAPSGDEKKDDGSGGPRLADDPLGASPVASPPAAPPRLQDDKKQEQAAPPPATPTPSATQTAPVPAPAPAAPPEPKKPPPDFRKESPPNTRIFVVGCEAFAVENVPQNHILLQSVVDYMANEDLGTLRAKRIEQRMFEDPPEGRKTLTKWIGWFAAPVLLLGLGILTHFWRRVIRPARARRAMAAARPA